MDRHITPNKDVAHAETTGPAIVDPLTQAMLGYAARATKGLFFPGLPRPEYGNSNTADWIPAGNGASTAGSPAGNYKTIEQLVDETLRGHASGYDIQEMDFSDFSTGDALAYNDDWKIVRPSDHAIRRQFGSLYGKLVGTLFPSAKDFEQGAKDYLTLHEKHENMTLRRDGLEAIPDDDYHGRIEARVLRGLAGHNADDRAANAYRAAMVIHALDHGSDFLAATRRYVPDMDRQLAAVRGSL